jgi:hypothetical protein
MDAPTAATTAPAPAQETVSVTLTPGATAADPRLEGISLRALRAEVTRRRRESKSRDARATARSSTGRYVETTDYLKMVRRMVKAAGDRTGQMDPESLAELAGLIDDLKDVETAAACALNDAGFSWSEIGAAQGLTKPTVFRKYRRTPNRSSSRKGR